MIRGDKFLLKYISCSESFVDILLETKWETCSNIDIGWIINHIDNLYILTDFNDVRKMIGFMLYDKGILYCIEILEKYRNMGYCTDIINHLNVKKIHSLNNTSRFWKKFALSSPISKIELSSSDEDSIKCEESEEGDYFLLKDVPDPEMYIEFLTKTKWETRPGLDTSWIIQNIDDLYILTDFNDTRKMIGFMVYDELTILYYMEILKQYRNMGYGTSIIQRMYIKKVFATKDTRNFWRKFVKDEKICKQFN